MKVPSIPKSPLCALPLAACLAKTRRTPDGACCAGRSVEAHCCIVGAVAEALLARLPAAQRVLFPPGSARPALVHDVGKVCPTFQHKIYAAANLHPENMPELKVFSPAQERAWGGHAAVSAAECHSLKNAPWIDAIVGQHHGFSCAIEAADAEFFGNGAWHARRQELLDRLLAHATAPLWPEAGAPEIRKLIAGLTIVADWIGSGPLFDDPDQPWESLVSQAIDAAGFGAPRLRQGLSFEDIFSFSPRDMQAQFCACVRQPGVYVLEAPMGQGKTEAALYAAYRLMACGQSAGIYFALPTQLTSDSMYTRFTAFLQKILIPEDNHQVFLLHAKAWLTHFLRQEMGEEAAPDGAWFASGKRGILAPFAVGTVDQALMAAMHVRHSAVRAFGLAGKTVILDEVHSYDAYTGTLLDALVAQLRRCGCTVIILSATLTAERRAAFTGSPACHTAYPLISAAAETLQEVPCPPPAEVSMALCHAEEETAVEEALRRAEQGQQVLWIENTVADAQQRYLHFAARAGALRLPVGLLHSRFTQVDRSRNEALWTTLYGKNAAERQKTGRILIGTQVLEQSLDIDADFLVTRFCPTDMLFQRLGRLWRHAATPRPPLACREAFLLHPPLAEALHTPQTAFGSTGHVYAPYVLCRSLELWQEKTSVTLPEEIRPLLEATYAPRTETMPAMAAALRDVEQERRKLHNIALSGISSDGRVLQDFEILTRAGQRPTVDVLLLRSLDQHSGEAVLADGTAVRLAGGYDWARRREIAAQLSLNIVRVPEYCAPAAASAKVLAQWIAPWLHCMDKNSGELFLRLALVHASHSLYNLSNVPFSHVSYRADYGYLVK